MSRLIFQQHKRGYCQGGIERIEGIPDQLILAILQSNPTHAFNFSFRVKDTFIYISECLISLIHAPQIIDINFRQIILESRFMTEITADKSSIMKIKQPL